MDLDKAVTKPKYNEACKSLLEKLRIEKDWMVFKNVVLNKAIEEKQDIVEYAIFSGFALGYNWAKLETDEEETDHPEPKGE